MSQYIKETCLGPEKLTRLLKELRKKKFKDIHTESDVLFCSDEVIPTT